MSIVLFSRAGLTVVSQGDRLESGNRWDKSQLGSGNGGGEMYWILVKVIRSIIGGQEFWVWMNISIQQTVLLSFLQESGQF